MSVTFIVPAFNAETTLAQTIESVLRQTSQFWSAVVVNDGSTDNTQTIATSFNDHRVGLVSQENKGLSAARNAGVRHVLEHSAGQGDEDLVCFLDADDCVSPRYVEAMTGAISDADIAPAAFRMMGEKMEYVGWTVTPCDHDFALDRLVHVNPVAPGAALVRLSAMRRLGVLGDDGRLFDESLRSAEDWDLWLRASAAGARWAPVVEEPLFDYRMRRGSMSDALRTMHDSSERVIERCSSPQRDLALRGLSLRSAARAVAAGDHDFARERLLAAEPLQENDIGVFVGALRYAFMFAECIGPALAAERWSAWMKSIKIAFPDLEAMPEVLARLSFDADQIPRAAAALLREITGDQVPVLYGIGRNGRSFAKAFRSVEPSVGLAWVDDCAEAAGKQMGQRLRTEELDQSHFVIVTPDENSAILRALAATGARVETIASLATG